MPRDCWSKAQESGVPIQLPPILATIRSAVHPGTRVTDLSGHMGDTSAPQIGGWALRRSSEPASSGRCSSELSRPARVSTVKQSPVFAPRFKRPLPASAARINSMYHECDAVDRDDGPEQDLHREFDARVAIGGAGSCTRHFRFLRSRRG